MFAVKDVQTLGHVVGEIGKVHSPHVPNLSRQPAFLTRAPLPGSALAAAAGMAELGCSGVFVNSDPVDILTSAGPGLVRP